ncbi:MAG: ELM1/GtrOC1 family putative glycosyltransferase [Deltaproteobacteria bacterium]
MGKNILVLTDDRTGNRTQAIVVSGIVSEFLDSKGIPNKVDFQEIRFKSPLARNMLVFGGPLAGRSPGTCLWWLKASLQPDIYRSLSEKKPDIVISGGSATAPVNVAFSRAVRARSIAVMRPSLVGLDNFDLVIIPRHDHPPALKNVVVTEGVLNMVGTRQASEYSRDLLWSLKREKPARTRIGLLLGGHAKSFRLTEAHAAEVIKQVKMAAQDLDGQIFVSTSRRTPPEVESLVKREFSGHGRCRLMVIANEKNIPGVVHAILAASDAVVISPESMMMISEAVNSGKYVIVFEAPGAKARHMDFLDHFAKSKYIYMTSPSTVRHAIKDILAVRPPPRAPSGDVSSVKEALEAIL